MGEKEMHFERDLNSEMIPRFDLGHRKKQVRRLILKEGWYWHRNLEDSAKVLCFLRTAQNRY